MDTVLKNISQYQQEYLIIDGTIPIVANSTIADEMILYNLNYELQNMVIKYFNDITKKIVNSETDVNILSYGQRVIFAVLCSIFCSAKKVMLRRVESSIDANKLVIIKKLISMKESEGKFFLIKND